MRPLTNQDGTRRHRPVEVLARGLALVTLLGAVAGIGWSVYVKWDVGRRGERYMLVSSRPVSDDLFFRELASQTALFRYTRADSALGAELRRQMPFSGPLGLYTEKGGRTVSVSTSVLDMSAATRTAQRSIEAKAIPAVFLGVVAGAAIGALLGSSLWMALGGLGLAACAAVYKLVAGCPTCEPSMIGPVRTEIVGAAAFCLVGAGLCTRLLAPSLAAVLCGATVVGQLAATLGTGTDCLPCALVACGCAAVLFAHVGKPAQFPQRKWAALLVPAAAIGTGIASPAPRAGGSANLLRSRTTWLGKDLRQLGAVEVPKEGERLIVVWSRGCRPCEAALERLAAEPQLKADLYLGLRPGQAQRARGERHIELSGALDQTPAFFVIDADGKVTAEYLGWSMDKEWEDQFVATLEHDLATIE